MGASDVRWVGVRAEVVLMWLWQMVLHGSVKELEIAVVVR